MCYCFEATACQLIFYLQYFDVDNSLVFLSTIAHETCIFKTQLILSLVLRLTYFFPVPFKQFFLTPILWETSFRVLVFKKFRLKLGHSRQLNFIKSFPLFISLLNREICLPDLIIVSPHLASSPVNFYVIGLARKFVQVFP